MRISTNLTENPAQIDILLFEAFSNLCLANAVEPLRAANTLSRRKLYQWRFLTLDGQSVTSSSDLPILPDGRLGPETSGDTLIVISSYGHQKLDTRYTRQTIARAARRYRTVIGLDTGAWLMASAGLLNGHRATIHNDLAPGFAETFLNIDTVRAGFVIDHNRITCGGAMATFDLILELIGQTHGKILKMDLSALFLHNRIDSAGQPALDVVRRATALMLENIETPLPIHQICADTGCNIKYLERRFLRQLGRTPAQVYQHLRLSEIRRLIETTDLPITEISVRGGYENASAMTRAFRKKFGLTPRKLKDKQHRPKL